MSEKNKTPASEAIKVTAIICGIFIGIPLLAAAARGFDSEAVRYAVEKGIASILLSPIVFLVVWAWKAFKNRG